MSERTGEMLVYHRIKAGLKQYEVARLTGIAQAQIGSWERGIVEPRYSAVVRILKAMGYSIFIVTEEEHDDIINFLRQRASGDADSVQGGVRSQAEREGTKRHELK